MPLGLNCDRIKHNLDMLTTKQKSKTIGEFATHKKDTGSPEVQIGLLSKKIKELSRHLKKHSKDVHSRRGLLGMVSRRRKLLTYLEKESPARHSKIVKKIKP